MSSAEIAGSLLPDILALPPAIKGTDAVVAG